MTHGANPHSSADRWIPVKLQTVLVRCICHQGMTAHRLLRPALVYPGGTAARISSAPKRSRGLFNKARDDLIHVQLKSVLRDAVQQVMWDPAQRDGHWQSG